MMYMPSIFGESLVDDFMKDFDAGFFGRRNPLYGKHAKDLMKTDVKETDSTYELDIDLPGFKKENLQIELDHGYLSITANKQLNKDETSQEGRMIRQERYSGSLQRSFYVGEDMTEEDVKARFEDGVLRLTLPKKEAQQSIPEKKMIAIEG